MRFRAVADGVDEELDIPIVRQTITDRDRELNARVVDRVFIGPDGKEHREWIGTPEELAACAKINPLSAALFSMCHRVKVHDGPDGMKWLRKADGAELVAAPQDDPVR